VGLGFVYGHWSSHFPRDHEPLSMSLTLLVSIASDFILACYWPWALPHVAPWEAAQKPGDVGRDNDIVPKSLGGVIL
jgi:hypothetical protein